MGLQLIRPYTGSQTRTVTHTSSHIVFKLYFRKKLCWVISASELLWQGSTGGGERLLITFKRQAPNETQAVLNSPLAIDLCAIMANIAYSQPLRNHRYLLRICFKNVLEINLLCAVQSVCPSCNAQLLFAQRVKNLGNARAHKAKQAIKAGDSRTIIRWKPPEFQIGLSADLHTYTSLPCAPTLPVFHPSLSSRIAAPRWLAARDNGG